MSELARFQYVTGEDQRVFPAVKVGDDEYAGFTLDVGQVIEATENPDPSRFAELVPPAAATPAPAAPAPAAPAAAPTDTPT